MKTVEIKIYSFNELSDEAREKALNNYVNTFEFFWGSEAIQSLEALCEHFSCRLINYSIDWANPGHSSIRLDCPKMKRREIRELLNELGSYDPDTLKGLGDCKLTGVCYDEDCIDGFRKEFFDGEKDLNELIRAGFETLLESCCKEYEYETSEKGFEEYCEGNDIEFTEDGEIFR